VAARPEAEHGARGAAILDRLDWFFHRTPIPSLPGLSGDATTYFDEGAKVPRHAKVTWRYKRSTREFRDRERSFAETARRGGGASLGGDNLEASDEMIRFIRHALLRRVAGEGKAGGGDADRLVGPHGLPFARDYAIPLFINAISCYVELGYRSNAEDRRLFSAHEEAYAEGIAVGVYSLLYGMRPTPAAAIAGLAGFASPSGKALDLRPYRKGRDYFQEAHPRECAIPDRVLAFREKFETLPSSKLRPDGSPAPALKVPDGEKPASKPKERSSQTEGKEKPKGREGKPKEGQAGTPVGRAVTPADRPLLLDAPTSANPSARRSVRLRRRRPPPPPPPSPPESALARRSASPAARRRGAHRPAGRAGRLGIGAGDG
jgi:hypothetical protein